MKVQAITTRTMKPPKDDLYAVIRESVQEVPERSVFVVTSKVVAIHQGRCVRMDEVEDKDDLIAKEAERYLPREMVPHGWVMLAIKENILLPTAGIDESNADGYYVLLPKDVHASAKEIWEFVQGEYGTKEFGVIICDSRTLPLRWGVMGVSLGFWGMDPLIDYRGTKDLFGREMKLSMANAVDSLAVAAVLEMGESGESKPLALVSEVGGLRFGENKENRELLSIASDEDLFAPLINSVEWREGGGGRK